MNDSGFWIEENVLSPEECMELGTALSHRQQKRSRAGARHLMSNPAVASTANIWDNHGRSVLQSLEATGLSGGDSRYFLQLWTKEMSWEATGLSRGGSRLLL